MPQETSAFIRYVGVISDGSTDYDIIKKFVTTLLEPTGSCEVVQLGGKLRDDLDRFWRESDKANDYNPYNPAARELRKKITLILYAALSELEKKMPREMKDCDLLVLNSDAEKPISLPDNYFEQRIFIIPKIFSLVIEEFYHKFHQQGYQRKFLPMVLPLVLFPSSEILVAAFRHSEKDVFRARGKQAKELKQELFGTDDMRRLGPDEFDKVVLSYITRTNCEKVYKFVPESRHFIRSLLWNQLGEVQG
jgi:hypothetical protein